MSPDLLTHESLVGAPAASARFAASTLGDSEFRRDHRVRLAYASGAMYKGIASVELVARMAKSGLLAFFGTGGLRLDRVEEAILRLKRELGSNQAFGMNLLCNLANPAVEDSTVDLFFRHGIARIEAAAFTQVTPSVVRYRIRGLRPGPNGPAISHLIMAKVSRPEVAEQFLSPAPERILQKLLAAQKISDQEAVLARQVPLADDLCVEADSGGHTDNGVALTLLPVMLRMRDEACRQWGYKRRIRVGAAGGIGTPHAVAAAFVMGADFVLTGSINQCTVEAGTSELAKDMLADLNVQDTAMAPAGDMFEIGARVQVMSKGVFFPARANRLFELYRQYDSLDQIDPKTREQLETRYFRQTFDEVYAEAKEHYLKIAPDQIERAEKNPKAKMALVFKGYFVRSGRLALKGAAESKVDFQIHTGPALGAFNQWVKGTPYENWRNRHPDKLADLLMDGAARLLEQRFEQFQGRTV
jgi:trans-AT polyketide synthase/acyltransferase/oxidoreductase domain-containing protein